MKNFTRLLSIFVVGGALAACSTVGDYLNDNRRDENVSGERVSVLQFDNSLSVDERIQNMPVNLPRAYTNVQWPQPGGAPSNAMQHLELQGELERAWSRSAGAGSGNSTRMTATPVMANGKIFLLDAEAQVFALDAETGRRIWRERIRRRDEGRRAGFGGGVAHAVDRVIVTTGYGDVYALDEDTGDVLWQRDVGVPVRTAPTVMGGRAFFVTTDNQLIAVDTTDGDVDWNYRAFSESAGILAPTAPAANQDVVVAPFTSGELNAVRIATGSVAWSDQLTRTGNFTPLANINAIAARPVISEGRVYAVSHSGRFVAIDLRTGERIWSLNLASTQTPWVAGDFAFLVTTDAQLVCVSLRDGRVRWLTQMDQYQNERRQRGNIQWVGPVLISDRLVVINSEGRLHEYNPHTGEHIDEVRVGDPVSLPPIVANNMLYVYTDDADLVAFHGENRERPARNRAAEVRNENAAPESSDDGEDGEGRRRWWWPWSSQ